MVKRLFETDEFAQQRIVSRIRVAAFTTQKAIEFKLRLGRKRNARLREQAGSDKSRSRDRYEIRGCSAFGRLQIGQPFAHQ